MAEGNTTSVDALRAEIVRRRYIKIDAANEEANRALSALSIVADVLSDVQPQVADSTETPAAPRWGEPKKPLPTATWVAEIVNSLNGSTVSQPLVYERLINEHAADFADRDTSSIKGQIAMILKRMETKGDLVVHKKAHGPDPTEYRRRTVTKQVPVKLPT